MYPYFINIFFRPARKIVYYFSFAKNKDKYVLQDDRKLYKILKINYCRRAIIVLYPSSKVVKYQNFTVMARLISFKVAINRGTRTN